MTRAPFLLPALLRFSGAAARADSWGRLLKVTAGGAELSTPARLSRGDRLEVEFELGGERLAIAASVRLVQDDDDGRNVAELRWEDMIQRRRLARAIVETLSRA